MREGIKTAIIGRPNVGKSSLMNSLVQEERAIVTDVPGTTRDVIEEYVNVRGIPLQLIDTAGIRETKDIVEKIGVERSHQILAEADLVLFMLNHNEPLTDDDRQIFALLEDLNYIVIINKIDLDQQIDTEEIKSLAKDNALITTSLIEEKGIDDLEAALAHLFFSKEIATEDGTYVSNVRHIQLLKQSKEALEEATNALALNMPLDIVQIDIRRTWEYLGKLLVILQAKV